MEFTGNFVSGEFAEPARLGAKCRHEQPERELAAG